MNDIDRCVKTVAGEDWVVDELITAVNRKWRDEDCNTYEDEFYKIRGFKKGTVHMWIKKQWVVDILNKQIGEYCGGNALANEGAGS